MWHNVHVRNISSSLSESALARVFAGCGRILDCRLCGESNSEGKLRFAFIAFSTSKEVDQALTLDGFVLEGSALRVLRSKTAVIPVNPSLLPQSMEDIERCSRTVYVANVDPRLTPGEVRATFEELCGAVMCMHQQLNNRRDTQVAFIEFAEASSAMTALGCSGHVIGQRQVRVSPSKTPLQVNAARLSNGASSSRGGPGENDGGEEEEEEEREEEEPEGKGTAEEPGTSGGVVVDDDENKGNEKEKEGEGEEEEAGKREDDLDGAEGGGGVAAAEATRSPDDASSSPPPADSGAGGGAGRWL